MLGISLFSRGNYHYYLKHKFDCGSTDLANGSHAQEEFSMRESDKWSRFSDAFEYALTWCKVERATVRGNGANINLFALVN